MQTAQLTVECGSAQVPRVRGFSKCQSGWLGVRRAVMVDMPDTYRIGFGQSESRMFLRHFLCIAVFFFSQVFNYNFIIFTYLISVSAWCQAYCYISNDW